MTARLLLWPFVLLAVFSLFAPNRVMADDRRSALFDADWRFHLGDVKDAQSLQFDDANWRRLDLPHDWSIEQPFSENLASGTGYLPGGVGWYRKTFTLPAAKTNQHVAVRFDGVYMNARVWINGHDLGLRPNGFVSVQYDLTPYLQSDGKPNVLAVRVDHTEDADSRFYTGSGIYRDVFLITTNDVAIEPDGVFVSTSSRTSGSASVQLQVAIANRSNEEKNVTLVSEVRDPTGASIAQSESSYKLAAGGTRKCDQEIIVFRPSRWSCEHPNLYQITTTVNDGSTLSDRLTTPFGIRDIAFDADKGFSLNGQRVVIKGVCLHQDAGALGAAVPREVFASRLRSLKELGCNAIRSSHNPASPHLLDLCDEMGFLVMDEAFDEWARPKKKWVTGRNNGTPSTQGYSEYFAEWSTRDVQAMVQRDRNHPSIILWSIGNEIDYPKDPYFDLQSTTKPSAAELPPIARSLAAAVKAIDTTRPVTAALADVRVSNQTGLPDALDVAGYNYQEQFYVDDHAKYPKRKIIGSENGHFYPVWKAVEDLPYATGQILWTGFDYLGEADRWPIHGSPPGLLDEAGFKKAAFYFRQSLWSDKPMVYLATRPGRGATTRPRNFGRFVIPSWSEPARGGNEVDVVCYTNCQRVELLLNDKSLGVKRMTEAVERVLTWRVPFSPGKLKAMGYNGEASACSYELITPGKAHHIRLTPEEPTIPADGRSLGFVRAQIVDEADNPLYFADQSIQFDVTGPARIRAVDSGDLTSRESFQSNHRRAEHGRCLLIVQSAGDAGTISIHASADGLAGEVNLQSVSR